MDDKLKHSIFVEIAEAAYRSGDPATVDGMEQGALIVFKALGYNVSWTELHRTICQVDNEHYERELRRRC